MFFLNLRSFFFASIAICLFMFFFNFQGINFNSAFAEDTILSDENEETSASSDPSLDEMIRELKLREKQDGKDVASNNKLKEFTSVELLEIIRKSGAENVAKLKKTGIDYKAIYGPDDRQDWYMIKSGTIKDLALSSVAMFKPETIKFKGGKYIVKSETLGSSERLCKGEVFYDQPSAAFCSGVLIEQDKVLTAGHCVLEIAEDEDVPRAAEIHFVFGYAIYHKKSGAELQFDQSHVYKGKADAKVIGKLKESDGEDWAIIQLDRSVHKDIAAPNKNWREADIKKGVSVSVIGYPNGLPLKYAPNSKVRKTVGETYFVANLDTFGGNSGSPVYDSNNKLAGILVRGEQDYELPDDGRSCYVAKICPNTGCDGEDVTNISLIKKRLEND